MNKKMLGVFLLVALYLSQGALNAKADSAFTLDCPTRVKAGEEFGVSAVGNSIIMGKNQYFWDFDALDGVNDFLNQGGSSVSHSYRKPGAYNVTAKAVSETGENFCQQCQIDVGNPALTGQIKIYEIFPNPTGADNAPLPQGEWLNLLNVSDNYVDVSGWMLYDSDDTHELFITLANVGGLDNLKELMIPPRGAVTVFRNGDSDFSLNNEGDGLRLYSGPIEMLGELQDETEYGATREGNGYRRNFDTGEWEENGEVTSKRVNSETVNQPNSETETNSGVCEQITEEDVQVSPPYEACPASYGAGGGDEGGVDINNNDNQQASNDNSNQQSNDNISGNSQSLIEENQLISESDNSNNQISNNQDNTQSDTEIKVVESVNVQPKIVYQMPEESNQLVIIGDQDENREDSQKGKQEESEKKKRKKKKTEEDEKSKSSVVRTVSAISNNDSSGRNVGSANADSMADSSLVADETEPTIVGAKGSEKSPWRWFYFLGGNWFFWRIILPWLVLWGAILGILYWRETQRRRGNKK